MKINYRKENIELSFNLGDNKFTDNENLVNIARFLKGIFSNKPRFKARFIDEMLKPIKEYGNQSNIDTINSLLTMYDEVEPFTYREAFELEDREFQAKVFGSINITEMMNNLGSERIATEGKQVKHKTFDFEGNFTGYKDYDLIYEVHKINGEKLNLEEDLFAVKCWCTTTDKEHWLWIEEEYKENPLEAIASTFRIHENLIPYIKEIKRQGDILLVEMLDDTIEPSGNIVPLNAEQYFRLLTAQS